MRPEKMASRNWNVNSPSSREQMSVLAATLSTTLKETRSRPYLISQIILVSRASCSRFSGQGRMLEQWPLQASSPRGGKRQMGSVHIEVHVLQRHRVRW
jgi:hypothetical protein